MNNKKQARTAAKDVDAYLAALPEAERATLAKLRNLIKTTAPKATEGISYQIPTYKYHGMLVCFAAFPNHCSFYVRPAVLEAHKEEVAAYQTSKGTIRFAVNKPLPAALVRKLIKAQMAANEAKAAAKSNRAAT